MLVTSQGGQRPPSSCCPDCLRQPHPSQQHRLAAHFSDEKTEAQRPRPLWAATELAQQLPLSPRGLPQAAGPGRIPAEALPGRQDRLCARCGTCPVLQLIPAEPGARMLVTRYSGVRRGKAAMPMSRDVRPLPCVLSVRCGSGVCPPRCCEDETPAWPGVSLRFGHGQDLRTQLPSHRLKKRENPGGV